MSDALTRLLSLELQSGKLLILTHDNPDPDSLASAAALRYLLRTRGVDATVAYRGIVGRAENRTMFELLDLDIRHLDHVEVGDYEFLALVDAQPFTGNSAVPDGRLPDIVIDHHPLRELTTRARFFDVREEVGASATILTSYLREADVDIPRDLATALLYGIRSETQDLTRETSEDDHAAYRHLLTLADPEKLALISRPKLPSRYFVQMGEALDSILVAGDNAICGLAEVIDPDFVPEMADFIARMEGMDWVFVFGYFRGHLYVSIRTNDAEATAGEVMQRVLHGIGSGGGHGMRAGGNVPVNAATERVAMEREITRRFATFRHVEMAAFKPLRTSIAESFTISSSSRS